MAKMQYRVLGSSGMKVSQLCLGTMMFGGQTDATQASRIIDHALESGVNFIDTANIYGYGESEEIIAEALDPYPALARVRENTAGTAP